MSSAQSPPAVQDWYTKAASTYQVPWYWLAAVDAYGRELTKQGEKDGNDADNTGFHFYPQEWAGLTNPNPADIYAFSVAAFGGRGADGNHDGLADPNNPYDRTAAIARWLRSDGSSEEDYARVLWARFEQEEAPRRVQGIASVFKAFRTTALSERVFPVHKRYDFSYRDTWGDPRGFGGRRIHEGTDIFAGYGTPLLSTCYGFIELKGWNRFGGWRLGIRSTNNLYFYYAHLSSFARGLHQGAIVRPGQTIGYVGSSGYGRPGTSGKFPPHLHFGMYGMRNGRDIAFDPYPFLRRWQRFPQTILPSGR